MHGAAQLLLCSNALVDDEHDDVWRGACRAPTSEVFPGLHTMRGRAWRALLGDRLAGSGDSGRGADCRGCTLVVRVHVRRLRMRVCGSPWRGCGAGKTVPDVREVHASAQQRREGTSASASVPA